MAPTTVLITRVAYTVRNLDDTTAITTAVAEDLKGFIMCKR